MNQQTLALSHHLLQKQLNSNKETTMTPTKVLTGSITLPMMAIRSAVPAIPPVTASLPLSIKSISLNDSRTVEAFGEVYTNTLSKLSSALATSEAKLKNMGEVGNNITHLLTTAKSLDASVLLDKPNFLERMFKSTTTGIEKFTEKQKTVQEGIKEVSVRLLTDRTTLLSENDILQKVYDDHLTVVNDMNNLVTGGQIRLQELKTEFAAIKTEADKHEEGYLQIQNQQQLIDRFEQKLERLNTSKTILARQLVQIKIMQNTNLTESDTIKDTIDTAIPLWESQIGLYISTLKTKNSVDNRKAITEVINSTIQKNAELMNQNTKDIVEGSTSSLISIETVQAVQTSLISSITTLQAAAEIGRQKRADSFLQLAAMDEELKHTLIN